MILQSALLEAADNIRISVKSSRILTVPEDELQRASCEERVESARVSKAVGS